MHPFIPFLQFIFLGVQISFCLPVLPLLLLWCFKESVRQEKQRFSAHKCEGVPGQGTSLADLFREKGELTTKCSADNLFNCCRGQECGQAPSIQELLITCQRALLQLQPLSCEALSAREMEWAISESLQERESRAGAESQLWCISSGSGFNLLIETPILMAVRDHAINIILQLEFLWFHTACLSSSVTPSHPVQLLNTWANINKTGLIGEVLCLLRFPNISLNQGRRESTILGEHFQCNLSPYVPETTSVSWEECKCPSCKKKPLKVTSN